MNQRSRVLLGVIVALCLSIGVTPLAHPQEHPSESNPTQKKPAMSLHANGTFEVTVKPQPTDDKTEGRPSAECLLTSSSTATWKVSARARC